MAMEKPYSLQLRHEMLEATQWAAEFSWEELKIFARYLQVFRAGKGMPIFLEGSPGDHLCLLVSGKVRIVKEACDGERKTVTSILKGKSFGEMALFDGEPRSATVIAVEDTHMLVLTRAQFQQLMDAYPHLACKLLLKLGKIVSQRLRATTGQLVGLI